MRNLGIIFLSASILLALLFSVEFPRFSSRAVSTTPPLPPYIEMPTGLWGFNVTLEPSRMRDLYSNYYVEVVAGPNTRGSIVHFDLWVVNHTDYGMTEFGLLLDFLGYEELQMDYPDNYPYTLIRGHAKEINITETRRFRLDPLDRDGLYCFVLVNLWMDFKQYVRIDVTEHFEEPPRSLLQRNSATDLSTLIFAVIGVSMIVYPAYMKRNKRLARKRKRQL